MDLVCTTSRVVSLARSGSIAVARQLFDGMPQRDTVAWNAMLACYSKSGLSREALAFFFNDMRASGARPDAFSLTAALSASAEVRDLGSGRKLHALACALGLQSSLPVCNALIDVYGKCSDPSSASRVFSEKGERNEVSWCSLLSAFVASGQLQVAHRLFGEMPSRNSVAWNVLIKGYVQFGELELAVNVFKEMLASGCRGDAWTFLLLVGGCAEAEDPLLGCSVHGLAVKVGWSSAVEVNNSIMSFYAKFGWADLSQRIFDTLATKTQVSWNTMMDAHMRAGDIDRALSMFWKAPERNIISWTAIIGGFARNGHGEEALQFFVDMIGSHIQPDELTLGPILQTCASLAILQCGRMVHSYVVRRGYDSNIYVSNGLVNMYAKCGDIGASSRAFHGASHNDLVSWNTMLFGLALHGRASGALCMYVDMATHEVSPDGVTFVSLLMACCHSGLIEQGHSIFRTMSMIHGLPPEVDHVVCMVDMLARAGQLDKAHELLDKYSSMIDQQAADFCEALLSACTVHGNVGLGRKVGEELVRNEPQKEVGYVMLSNLFCWNGQWKEAEKVRKAMVLQGVKKLPGYSWVEVRNTVEVFVTGLCPVPGMEPVYGLLHTLELEMRYPNCIHLSRNYGGIWLI